MLYSIVPEEIVFGDDGEDGGHEGAAPRVFPWRHGRASLDVESVGGGFVRIVRCFSTDPRDYLNPSLEPGRLLWIGDEWASATGPLR